jgi:DHA1 family bicyclomycin/chloramphenicol resistance-like MFS transporter
MNSKSTETILSTKSIIFILGFMMTLGPMTIDMYLPGFSQIADDLKTSDASVALTLSSYFLGLGLGQLFYGPFLDRFGRKKPVYVGLGLYILASLLCVVAQNIDSFIVMRFFQAVGGCATGVATMTMVRDFFPLRERTSAMSTLMLILGIAPLIAPTIGGFVIEYVGWRGIFVILALYALVIGLIVHFILPEGHKPDKTVSLHPIQSIKNYFRVIKVRQFYSFAVPGAFCFGALFTYVAGSPVIFLEVYDMDAKTYGLVFGGLSLGMMGGSQLNRFLAKRSTYPKIFRSFIFSQVLFSTLLLVLSLLNLLTIEITIALLFLILMSVGTAFPNAGAIALAPFKRLAGSASALLGAKQITLGAIGSMIVGFTNATTITPIAFILAGFAWLALASLYVTTGLKEPQFDLEESSDSEI